MLVSGVGKRSWTKTTNVWILQLFVSMDQIISMWYICIAIQSMIGIWSFSSVKQTCDKWWQLCVFETTPCCHTCLGFPPPHLHRNLRITFFYVSVPTAAVQQHLLFTTKLSPCPQKADFRVQPFSAVFCFCQFDQLLIILRHFSFISSPRSYYGHSVLV